MPRSTTTATTIPSTTTQTHLGPFLIYYFQFAETSETKAERYLTLPVTKEYPAAIKLNVDTKATSWVFDPIPDAYNRFVIYHPHTPHEPGYTVLKAVKIQGEGYILAVELVHSLKDATVWTIEQGDRRNKIKFSTIFPDDSLVPIYWAVTRQGDGYHILVRDLGSNHREGEFVLEEVDLLD